MLHDQRLTEMVKGNWRQRIMFWVSGIGPIRGPASWAKTCGILKIQWGADTNFFPCTTTILPPTKISTQPNAQLLSMSAEIFCTLLRPAETGNYTLPLQSRLGLARTTLRWMCYCRPNSVKTYWALLRERCKTWREITIRRQLWFQDHRLANLFYLMFQCRFHCFFPVCAV